LSIEDVSPKLAVRHPGAITKWLENEIKNLYELIQTGKRSYFE
jgi:hypothetical protein